MRQFSRKTQGNCLRIVREFSRFLGRSLHTAAVEDLRDYRLHLADHGTSSISLNTAIDRKGDGEADSETIWNGIHETSYRCRKNAFVAR